MLYTKTVEPGTLGVIKDLFTKPYLDGYLLAGGTALALQLGHRTSTDIDLFITTPHDTQNLLENLKQDFQVEVRNIYRHALFINVNTVKTDIIFQKCNLIDIPVLSEGISLASLKEIAAMKLLAITNRVRKRDFVDLYFLIQHFSLAKMLSFYKEKFETDIYYLVLRSLTYFADAEEDSDLKYFFDVDWNRIKSTIIEEVKKIQL